MLLSTIYRCVRDAIYRNTETRPRDVISEDVRCERDGSARWRVCVRVPLPGRFRRDTVMTAYDGRKTDRTTAAVSARSPPRALAAAETNRDTAAAGRRSFADADGVACYELRRRSPWKCYDVFFLFARSLPLPHRGPTSYMR